MKTLGARISLAPADYPALRRPAFGDGVYLQVGFGKLNYIVAERGNEISRITFDSLDDALYAIFKDITFTKAATSEQVKKASSEMYLQCLYEYQLELLSRIDEKFAKRRKSELNADYFANKAKH